ncbi:P-loop containing nucleoside triphosphate hydrolases superfamily protein [Artemisia annua]|uniref:RNA helicase n=1 Tax=Artemisia annua TaxID=35608 RepID=A0A2U1MUJ7_ARTAN|nr:P-loop containing nucleoside triphosphate hydrolases superfamily protein [Artemisia annua]
MEKDPSFLFSGITFNRKRFSNDFARFKEKRESNDPEETLLENKTVEVEPAAKPPKKRKRKRTASDPVEGFSVFNSSKTESVLDNSEETELASQRKKEFNRQMERDAIFRKQHNIHTSGTNIPSPLHDFSELRSRYECKPYILRNLAELNIKKPTPIQMQAIPILLSGRDVFACAPTGSGKTLAFVCPMLMKLKRASKDGVRAVILCPTRELASQTYRECKKLAKGKKFYIKLMTKQLSNTAEFAKLSCDVLISTPLRLKSSVTKRKLDLSRVEYLVLDESDKLFELGLLEPVDAIVKACTNPSIIRSLFSATLPDTVEELARTIMHDAVRVIIGRKNSASETVKQKLVYVGSEEGKLMALRQTFEESWNPPVLLFVQNKARAKDLYNELKFEDIRVDVIHSDLQQSERENAIDNFRAGKTWVLIATDVIARGMDFKGVNCVINYDFPDSSSAYIHRIGRSGRAGRSGEAVTFYTDADVRYLKNIANAIKNAGSEVPEWILSMPKLKWRKHRPKRESLFAKQGDKEEE